MIVKKVYKNPNDKTEFDRIENSINWAKIVCSVRNGQAFRSERTGAEFCKFCSVLNGLSLFCAVSVTVKTEQLLLS